MKYSIILILLGLNYSVSASEPKSPANQLERSSSPIPFHCRARYQSFEQYIQSDNTLKNDPFMFNLPKSTLGVLITIFEARKVTDEDKEAIKICLPPDRDAVIQLQNEIDNVKNSQNLKTYHCDLTELLQIVQQRRLPLKPQRK